MRGGSASSAPCPRGDGPRRHLDGQGRGEGEARGIRQRDVPAPSGGRRARLREPEGWPARPGPEVRATRDGGASRSGAEALLAPTAPGLGRDRQAGGGSGWVLRPPRLGQEPRAADTGQGALIMASPVGRRPGERAPRPEPRPPPRPMPQGSAEGAGASAPLTLFYRRVQEGRIPGPRPAPSSTITPPHTHPHRQGRGSCQRSWVSTSRRDRGGAETPVPARRGCPAPSAG